MKIAIIGLGDIAKKAYLPVLSALNNIELVLCTRNEVVLNELGDKFKIAKRFKTVDELVKEDIDGAIVSTEATAHFDIVKKLVENGINVYVDKPISFNFDESKQLEELSLKYKKIIMVGFNRRFVPMFKKLKTCGKADIIIMQKNREYKKGDARRFIIEDFIHVVDTIRFLMDEEVEEIYVNHKKDGKDLENVTVTFKGKTTTAIGIMNRMAKITEEIVEYMVNGNKYIVNNLVEFVTLNNSGKFIEGYGGWESTLYKRGFDDLIEHFISCIKEGKTPEPSIADSVKSHELCEEILKRIEE